VIYRLSINKQDTLLSISTNHDNSQVAANIHRYFVYTALTGFSFGLIGAMWVIFLTQHGGLSLA
jgi:hypothetical protein